MPTAHWLQACKAASAPVGYTETTTTSFASKGVAVHAAVVISVVHAPYHVSAAAPA